MAKQHQSIIPIWRVSEETLNSIVFLKWKSRCMDHISLFLNFKTSHIAFLLRIIARTVMHHYHKHQHHPFVLLNRRKQTDDVNVLITKRISSSKLNKNKNIIKKLMLMMMHGERDSDFSCTTSWLLWFRQWSRYTRGSWNCYFDQDEEDNTMIIPSN